MKFLLTVAAIIAAAVAVPTQRGLVEPGTGGSAPIPELHPEAGPAPIVPELPDFGPAPVDTFEPIVIGPVGVDSYEPIVIGPVGIDQNEPIAIGPAGIDSFEPVVIGPGVTTDTNSGAPLVQIILNINQAAVEHIPVSPVLPAPIIVEEAAVPGPIQVIDVPLSPVEVVESVPVEIDPIAVGTPILPAPVINLPESLN